MDKGCESAEYKYASPDTMSLRILSDLFQERDYSIHCNLTTAKMVRYTHKIVMGKVYDFKTYEDREAS